MLKEMKDILKKLRQEIKILCDLKNEQAPDGEYFFAFSNEQFEEGKKRIGIEDNKQLCDAGSGMYGTKKGIEEFWAFHNERTKRIQAQISPLAFFYYEYGNCEGEYNSDDEAWDYTKELYPDFDFADEYNRKVVEAIRDEWRKLNFGR